MFLALICRRFLRFGFIYTHSSRPLTLALAGLSCSIHLHLIRWSFSGEMLSAYATFHNDHKCLCHTRSHDSNSRSTYFIYIQATVDTSLQRTADVFLYSNQKLTANNRLLPRTSDPCAVSGDLQHKTDFDLKSLHQLSPQETTSITSLVHHW